MIRLTVQDGYFIHPVTSKAELSIEGVMWFYKNGKSGRVTVDSNHPARDRGIPV